LAQQAATAAAAGDVRTKQAALADYVAVLQKVRGSSVDYAAANTLIQIARSL
jgi:hypothetical protein